MEFSLVRDVKDNKKGNKRRNKENVGPLLSETGDLVTQDTEKAEVLNVSFVSVFTSKTSFQESQIPATGGKSRASKVYPWCKKIMSGNISAN